MKHRVVPVPLDIHEPARLPLWRCVDCRAEAQDPDEIGGGEAGNLPSCQEVLAVGSERRSAGSAVDRRPKSSISTRVGSGRSARRAS